MQVHVRQQRRDHPSLRCSLPAPSRRPPFRGSTTGAPSHIRISFRTDRSTTRIRTQPSACRAESCRSSPRSASYTSVRPLEVLTDLRQRLVGRPSGTKPERTVQEVRLEDRLQDQQRRRLHHPVPDRRDAQWRFAVSALGCRPVSPVEADRSSCAGPLEARSRALRTAFLVYDLFDAHSIHPGCSTVPATWSQAAQARLADRSGRTRRKTGTSALASPSDIASASERDSSGIPGAVPVPGPAQSSPVFRSGSSAKRVSSLLHQLVTARPLRSTGITPLRRYYGPIRLPITPAEPYVFRRRWVPPPCPGLPGSRFVFRYAPSPFTPEGPMAALSAASPPVVGFITFGSLATLIGVTRLNRVRFRYGSRGRRSGATHPLATASAVTGLLPTPGCPSVGGRRYMANDQFPWLTPFSQLDAPGFAWRTEGTKTQRALSDKRPLLADLSVWETRDGAGVDNHPGMRRDRLESSSSATAAASFASPVGSSATATRPRTWSSRPCWVRGAPCARVRSASRPRTWRAPCAGMPSSDGPGAAASCGWKGCRTATDHDSAADRLDALELERAVASLPPAQVVIRLRFYLGLSFREIGNNLSISTNTAASRTRYALAGLRRRLGTPRLESNREERHE